MTRRPLRIRADSPALSTLRHPGWWFALSMLVLNDHVLKGSGTVPAIVTGKLSDFAGLLVASPLICLVCGDQTRARRAASLLLLAVAFTTINLSASASAALEDALSPLSWQLWPDPTDLAALPALLIAHFWMARATALAGEPQLPSAASRSLQQRRHALAGLGVVAGGVACLGTSFEPWETKAASAFLYNHRNAPLSVELYVASSLDCDTFDPEVDGRRLTQRDLLRIPADPMPPETWAALGDQPCGAAWVRLPGSFDQLVVWTDLPVLDPMEKAGRLTENYERQTLVFEGGRGTPIATAGADLRVLPAPRGLPDADASSSSNAEAGNAD